MVFVVDDDVSVRESLQGLISSAGRQVQTFGCAHDFLTCRRAPSASCLVLDMSLPDLHGLDLQQCVAADAIPLPIIFITGYGDVPMTVKAMKAGATELLTKPFQDHVLLAAIDRALLQSEAALGQAATLGLLRGKYELLSPREVEVMALVVSGLLNKQVGGELGISEITVKGHRGSVMRKMDAASLPDLVNMAARLGIAPAEDGTTSRFSRHR
jgi:FixJ family two-component response regulator